MSLQDLKAFVIALLSLLCLPPSLASEIQGIVRVGATDRLTNVTVVAQLQYPPSTRLSTITDSSGTFSIQVDDGAWSVFLDSAEPNARGLVVPAPRLVYVNNSSPYIEIVATRPDAALSGYVRDETGSGVSNVVVTAIENIAGNNFSTLTDANGFYQLALSSSFIWQVGIAPASLSELKLLSSGMFGISFYPGETAVRDIQVFRIKHTLNMTVVDESGAPVSGASATVNAYLGNNIPFELSPPFNGNSAKLELPTGDWIAKVTVPDGSVLPRRFHVTNSIDAQFVAHPPPPDATISGRLVDDNDQPIVNTPITLSGFSIITQASGPNGEFLFSVPAGECSLTISNQDFLLPTTRLVTAPASAISKTLRARKLTSQIQVNIDAPPLFLAMSSAAATTTVGVDEFIAPGIGSTNVAIRVFDGEWKVTANAWDSSYKRQEIAQIVNVPSNEQSFTATFVPQTGNAKISGKFADDSGAPLNTEFTAVGLIPGSGYWGFTGADGFFSFLAPPDDYRFGVDISPGTDALPANTNFLVLSMSFSALVRVADDDINVGTLTIPVSSAHLTLRLVNPQGTPLNVDDPYLSFWVTGAHNEARGSLRTERQSDTGVFEFDLPAGKWTFEFPDDVLNNSGYAGVGALSLDLHAGDNDYSVIIESLPTNPPPPMLVSALGNDGLPHVRLFQKKCWPVDIEASTDLKTWKFHANAFYNREFPIMPGQPKTFYRAVRSP